MTLSIAQQFENIQHEFNGEFRADLTTRKLYSTDASPYQQIPAAVAFPVNENDIRLLIELANRSATGLIPRTAGTSLAGQVVGPGIVVDVSRHFTAIGQIDTDHKTVWTQPGVIRNELNMVLAKHGLFFGPETSTANRAMIGGMLGNNSCGANSIVYGTTRDHTLEVRGFLSDGSKVHFKSLNYETFHQKTNGDSVEARIYHHIANTFGDLAIRQQILDGFPKSTVTRRNTGYALDSLVEPFEKKSDINLCQLIAGSEGTLFFATEIKLQCHDLPPSESALLCAHFESVEHALQATSIAMQYSVNACELIDHLILQGAARNIDQRQNMEFVSGEPAAILMIESRADNVQAAIATCQSIAEQLQNHSLGYAFPILVNDQSQQAWELRRAGLGVVANVPGDAKPVTVIEDTAVALADLADYIKQLNQILKQKYNAHCVHYAHAGAGEIHLRPVLNLKTPEGRKQFREIATDTAALVKKYAGSLSGEHGDGRLRSEFIEQMLGPECYQHIVDMKRVWDPNHIFNPGKIVDAPPMDMHLRAILADNIPTTVFSFENTQSILGAAEMCSGSADCRKTHLTGGTMCPSYMATRNESDTTRARANILRHVLTDPSIATEDALASDEIKSVMELCLSCKGCKSECPSNVDIAKLKAESQHAFHQKHGIPLRTRLIAAHSSANQWNSKAPRLFNFITQRSFLGRFIKKVLGFHPARSLPPLSRQTLRNWFKKHTPHPNAGSLGSVFLFCDEFTNYLDAHIGIATVQLLERLGYSVEIPKHFESGRAALSKGLLHRAQKLANDNVQQLHSIVSSNQPLIGIEPSAILGFRDEYPDLVRPALRNAATQLAAQTFLIDEFLDAQAQLGKITTEQFGLDKKAIRLHGHCHQKAIASLASTIRILQLPQNYTVRIIPSGCCGMAGSFGYEAEHYDISMQIGELVLFPTIRSEPTESIIAAPGTSCRHQIFDGTDRTALHPVQILLAALK